MKFEREVCLKLCTMETKTETNTMTNLQIVEGKEAQEEYDIFTCIKDKNVNTETDNNGFGRPSRDLQVENRTIFFYSKTRFNSGQFDIYINPLIKSNFRNYNFIDYELYKFYSSSSIIIFRRFYMFRGKTKIVAGYYFGSEHKINFEGRPCILTIDDFTQDFKMSGDSIEIQIGKMVDMNNRKHKQIERQEQKIREQESQMSLMQSIISSMQIQLQEQSKLIASLQLSLNENQREMRKKQVAIEEEVDILLRDE